MRAILQYLVQHPRAKETIEGIAQWWFEGEENKRMKVERAISVLVSQGLILETRREGLRPYYHLCPRRRAAALRILRKL